MSELSIEELILGQSSAIRAVRALVARLGPSQLPVLVQGPTGVGKELVAEALHRSSDRRRDRFVSVNVCAIAETMFEDALFGHVRGAFSGAFTDSPGHFGEAHQGSLFLDEVGGLAFAVQPKLLRAVETRRYRPIGAKADLTSDCRLIAAANEDLDGLAASGRFRFDLLQRLRVAVIQVPPLAERVDDVGLLAKVFAARARSDGETPRLTDEAIRYLEQRPWPGNVRELKHVVECAVVLTSNQIITRDDIAGIGRVSEAAILTNAAAARSRLVTVLNETDWNLQLAASRLAVHRVTLWRWMTRLGIRRPDPIFLHGTRAPRSDELDDAVPTGQVF